MSSSKFIILSFLILSSIPGMLSSVTITLGSIQIFRAHEWLHLNPTVYFHCQGENKTIFPDVKEKHFLYTFKGEESWQPLTELPDKKCKRCGLYEKDTIKSDDVFEEWELCLGDFINGSYVHYKHKEFNATFICLECTANISSTLANVAFIGSNSTNVTAEKMLTVSIAVNVTGSNSSNASISDEKLNVILEVIIGALVSVVVVAGMVGMVGIHRYWQKRKRQQDQGRFLKLFDDSDDIDDELDQF